MCSHPEERADKDLPALTGFDIMEPTAELFLCPFADTGISIMAYSPVLFFLLGHKGLVAEIVKSYGHRTDCLAVLYLKSEFSQQ